MLQNCHYLSFSDNGSDYAMMNGGCILLPVVYSGAPCCFFSLLNFKDLSRWNTSENQSLVRRLLYTLAFRLHFWSLETKNFYFGTHTVHNVVLWGEHYFSKSTWELGRRSHKKTQCGGKGSKEWEHYRMEENKTIKSVKNGCSWREKVVTLKMGTRLLD